jgi:hypothetical protein
VIEKRDMKTDPVVSFDEHRTAKMRSEQSLISSGELENLRARWVGIQSSFVDEPRKAVHDADELVSTALKQISDGFRDRRTQLEKSWSGDDASTEDLRVSFQNYRTFFDRLLSI